MIDAIAIALALTALAYAGEWAAKKITGKSAEEFYGEAA